jgi:hypothetical protein
LKEMRDPDPSMITGTALRGSYASMYWVLDGHHDEWNLWAVDQVRALHRGGRMFDARDHVHTLLYKYRFEVGRDPDGVPSELALDHPYKAMVAMWVDAPVGTERLVLEAQLRDEHVPAALRDSPAGLVVGWEPLPLQVDIPGVARSEGLERRVLLVWFMDEPPAESWATIQAARESIESAGHGTVIAALPYIPTIPGTDTYTDQLWVK